MGAGGDNLFEGRPLANDAISAIARLDDGDAAHTGEPALCSLVRADEFLFASGFDAKTHDIESGHFELP